MTIDGFCDHTAGVPDEELHDHYSDLLSDAGTILYGRTTYQLMQYWQEVLRNPTGKRSMDRFAEVIDRIPKVVFSHTLKDTGWETARLAHHDLKEEVLELRQQEGKDILVGSPGLIVSLTQLGLIDEYQVCVHPVIIGKGLPLFKNISEKIMLKLLETTTFGSGAIVLYYEPIRQ
jgi:dihydrofolate reductase